MSMFHYASVVFLSLAFAHFLSGCVNKTSDSFPVSVANDERFPHIGICSDASLTDEVWLSCKVVNGRCETNTPSGGATGRGIILWQTTRTISPTPSDLAQHNAKFLPDGSEIRWVDDAGMVSMMSVISREMAQAGVMNNLCEAFLLLRPGAFRADMWRAAVLWKYGGLYMDHHLALATDFSKFFERDSVDAFGMLVRVDGCHCAKCCNPVQRYITGRDDLMYQAIAFASAPKLTLWPCILAVAAENIAQRSYAGWHLGITFEPWAIGLKSHQNGQCKLADGRIVSSPHFVDSSFERKSEEGSIFGIPYGITIRHKATNEVMIIGSKEAHLAGRTSNLLSYEYLHNIHQVYCDESFAPGKLPIDFWYKYIRYCQICYYISDYFCEHCWKFNLECSGQEGHAKFYRPGEEFRSIEIADPCTVKLGEKVREPFVLFGWIAWFLKWGTLVGCLYAVVLFGKAVRFRKKLKVDDDEDMQGRPMQSFAGGA